MFLALPVHVHEVQASTMGEGLLVDAPIGMLVFGNHNVLYFFFSLTELYVSLLSYPGFSAAVETLNSLPQDSLAELVRF